MEKKRRKRLKAVCIIFKIVVWTHKIRLCDWLLLKSNKIIPHHLLCTHLEQHQNRIHASPHKQSSPPSIMNQAIVSLKYGLIHKSESMDSKPLIWVHEQKEKHCQIQWQCHPPSEKFLSCLMVFCAPGQTSWSMLGILDMK